MSEKEKRIILYVLEHPELIDQMEAVVLMLEKHPVAALTY